MARIELYHGSNKEIEKPVFQGGKKTNDYGFGFYCTEHYDLACEWAAKSNDKECYVNKYSIDTTEFKVLDLTDKKYSILNWLAILLENRTFTITAPIANEAKKYIIDNFAVDVFEYDIIKGYRADDSYFSFAEDFLNNTISLQQLKRAMSLGELGVQHVMISKKAFDVIKFDYSEMINKDEFYTKFIARDQKARDDYKNFKLKSSTLKDDIYVLDIIREGIKNGDSRI